MAVMTAMADIGHSSLPNGHKRNFLARFYYDYLDI